MKRAFLLAVALLTGCERSSTRRDLLGDVDGPVAVKVVEVKDTAPDLFGPPDPDKDLLRTKRAYELQLATKPKTRVSLNHCQVGRVDVSVSPERDRAAFRCVPMTRKHPDGASRWTIVYLVPGPPDEPIAPFRHFFWYEGAGPDSGMVVGGKIAWSAVPGFVEAAPKLLLPESQSKPAKDVLDEVERRAGPGAVEALLPEIVSTRPTINRYSRPDERDEWVVRLDRASPEGQKRALEALRAEIKKPNAARGAILRGALLLERLGVDETSEILGRRLLEMGTERLERKEEPSEVERRVLATLALRAPEHAVPLACRRLEARQKVHDYVGEAYGVLALARRGCGGAPKIEPLSTDECNELRRRSCEGDAQATCSQRAIEELVRQHFSDRRHWLDETLVRLAAVRADKGITDDDLGAVGCTPGQ